MSTLLYNIYIYRLLGILATRLIASMKESNNNTIHCIVMLRYSLWWRPFEIQYSDNITYSYVPYNV